MHIIVLSDGEPLSFDELDEAIDYIYDQEISPMFLIECTNKTVRYLDWEYHLEAFEEELEAERQHLKDSRSQYQFQTLWRH